MLVAGTRLGPYELVSLIGKGGMGEVYRARDTKLDRDVAIKVLPDELAMDEERVARFEREAKLLASLNHPNIASIYGFEESDGVKALVLELVEGPTLAERIAQGPIPVDETITIAKQIAEALEAGHEAGVIHRDLKPANIKLKEDGTAKVLDYGLAKALEGEGADERDSELSQSPTLTRQGTQVGVILGTAAYMSPEQAKGKRVDKRTDIWAFGAVVYEMLTGKRAFAGDDVSDTLAAVLRAEPNFDAIPSSAPDALRRVLRLALTKDVKERVRDIGDVRLALNGALFSEAMRETRVPTRHTWLAMAIGAFVAAFAGLAGWSVNGSDPVSAPVIRFSFSLGPGEILSNVGEPQSSIAISPDGSRVVLSASGQLHLRMMEEGTTAPIRGTEGARSPFFSPSGEWVGFWADGQIKKVPIRGGTAVSLCDAPRMDGAWWSGDDVVVFADESTGLMRVPASGGTPEVVVKNEPGSAAYAPQVLPGDEWVLTTLPPSLGAILNAQIVALSITSGEKRVLVERGRMGRYASTGHLTYVRDGTLYGAAFDVESLETRGEEVALVEDIRMTSVSVFAEYVVSESGTLVYLTGSGLENRTLAWMDRQGNEVALAAPPRPYAYPRISPDGGRIALDVRDAERDIWIWDLEGETFARLTFGESVEGLPVWTRDGKRVVFASDSASDALNLFWKAADGMGDAERLSESDELQLPYAFGAEEQLVFTTSGYGLRMLSPDGSSEPLIEGGLQVRNADVSHDGRFLAYQSDISGTWEVYVRPFPNVADGQWQVSNGGGSRPVWARDGSELYFLSKRGELLAVPVQTEGGFAHGNPEALFQRDYLAQESVLPSRIYDVSPDGKRFLIIRPGASDDTFHVVLNWTEELKARVPVSSP